MPPTYTLSADHRIFPLFVELPPNVEEAKLPISNVLPELIVRVPPTVSVLAAVL